MAVSCVKVRGGGLVVVQTHIWNSYLQEAEGGTRAGNAMGNGQQ